MKQLRILCSNKTLEELKDQFEGIPLVVALKGSNKTLEELKVGWALDDSIF